MSTLHRLNASRAVAIGGGRQSRGRWRATGGGRAGQRQFHAELPTQRDAGAARGRDGRQLASGLAGVARPGPDHRHGLGHGGQPLFDRLCGRPEGPLTPFLGPNCQSFVNSLLKQSGVSEKERVNKGELSGIDWGEEETLPATLFVPAPAPKQPAQKKPVKPTP
jgi:hypothetical protein